jgi:tetratricopeptide (TPR) repeat protein
MKAEYRIQGRSLILNFDGPLGDIEVETLASRWPELVEYASYGYDGLLVRAAQPVNYTISRSSNEVTVSLEPLSRNAQITYSDEGTTAQRIRLQALRTRVLFETGKAEEAQEMLHKLLNDHPDNPDVLGASAFAEQRLGKWREAVALYDRALSVNPRSIDHKRAKTELLNVYGNRVGLKTTYSYVEDNDKQIITRANGRKILDKHWSLNLLAENRFLEIDRVRRSDGNFESFNGVVNSADIEYGYDAEQARHGAIALLLNPGSVGARALVSLGPPAARTQFELAYREPEFRYVEGIVDNATRERMAISHRHDLMAKLHGVVGVSYQRYNVADDSDVAKTLGVDLSLDYTFRSAAKGPTITGGYFLEAEYVEEREVRIDVLGEPFSPLPLVDREVHGVNMSLENRLATGFNYTVIGGYVLDRFNEQGPIAGLNLSYRPNPSIEFQLPLSYSIATSRGTGDKVYSAGLFFIWYL